MSSEKQAVQEGPPMRRTVVAICTCGGWVMVAALGFGAKTDAESFKEAGKLAARGFDVRTMPKDDFHALAMCQRAATCISPRPSSESESHA